MGIINSFLIKFTRSDNIRGVRLALDLYSIINNFEKLFFSINPFRNKGVSLNVNNNQALNHALERSVKNLDVT
ncbi:MAG: hypothetical protein ACR5KV_01965 [Wolbachia sp.]